MYKLVGAEQAIKLGSLDDGSTFQVEKMTSVVPGVVQATMCPDEMAVSDLLCENSWTFEFVGFMNEHVLSPSPPRMQIPCLAAYQAVAHARSGSAAQLTTAHLVEILQQQLGQKTIPKWGAFAYHVDRVCRKSSDAKCVEVSSGVFNSLDDATKFKEWRTVIIAEILLGCCSGGIL